MNEHASKPPGSLKPAAPPKVPSGMHPAVVAYRDKLDSVAEGAGTELSAIDAELAEFLAECRTPVPPPGGEFDDEAPTERLERP